MRACPSASSAVNINMAMCRIRSGCCAFAASGHTTAAPPSAASNSRRPMVTVMRRSRARFHLMIGRQPYVAFGNSTGDREMLEWTAAAVHT
jgi:hypothetical protein